MIANQTPAQEMENVLIESMPSNAVAIQDSQETDAE